MSYVSKLQVKGETNSREPFDCLFGFVFPISHVQGSREDTCLLLVGVPL